MAGLRNRPILEVRRIDVFSLDDAATADVAHDVERAVGGTGIGDQNLVGDAADRFDAGPNVASLIFTRDERGKFCGHNPPDTLAGRTQVSLPRPGRTAVFQAARQQPF